MKCEALANISRVMTNERSFSVVNASVPVGTTDKLSDFLLYLPGVPPVSCRAPKGACHHFTICSAYASQLVRSKLIVC